LAKALKFNFIDRKLHYKRHWHTHHSPRLTAIAVGQSGNNNGKKAPTTWATSTWLGAGCVVIGRLHCCQGQVGTYLENRHWKRWITIEREKERATRTEKKFIFCMYSDDL